MNFFKYLLPMIAIAALLIVNISLNAGDKKAKVTNQQAFNLVSEYIEAWRVYKQIPGVALGIIHDQKIIYQDYFGYANPEKKIKPTGETLFSICSISKLFTSVATLKLVEDNKLSLDDPLNKYITDLGIKQNYKHGPLLTLKSVLTHSSGLPREAVGNYWMGSEHDFPASEQVLKLLKEQETLYPVNTRFQYSNLAMSLLGEVIERVSDQSYRDYIVKTIVAPLKMESTEIDLSETLKGTDKVAQGYSFLGRSGKREKTPYFATKGITPAAGVWSNINDLSRFMNWQFRLLGKEKWTDKEIITGNTLREMQRVQWMDDKWKSKSGYGFRISRSNDRTIVGHTGGCPGFYSVFYTIPNKKLGIILLTNATGIDSGAVAKKVFDMVLTSGEKPSKGSSSKKKSPFQEFVGSYDYFPFWGEVIVFPWKDSLAALSYPSDDPLKEMIKFKHLKGDVFQAIKKDDALGEKIRFERDSEGKVKAMSRHSYYLPRINE